MEPNTFMYHYFYKQGTSLELNLNDTGRRYEAFVLPTNFYP